ncbi:extracellular solute-binding protein [Radiobacillus sp. PE A8.2]|uniref:extracellular solute-binding protein n=1 Tax=Radiobacillus sp. PE A8.2 TaxID=3380349 RepID=UPI00388F625E
MGHVRLGILILLVFSLFSITSCKDQSIIDGKPMRLSDNPDVKEEVIIWHTFSEEETNIFNNYIIPAFEKEFSSIEVTPVRQAYNEELRSAIIARASTNNPPDVVRMDIAWLPKFAQLDLLYPVSSLNEFNNIKDNLYDGPLQANLYQGKYYGVPLNTNTKVALYNKKLLETANIKELPETMEELIDIVVKNDFVIGVDDLSPWETYHYFNGLGGVLLDPTNTRASGYLDSDASIKAVKKFLSLYKNGNFTPNLFDNPNTWEGVLDKTYFMIDEGPWFYSVNTLEKINFINELTMSSPFPITDGKRAVLGGESLVITKGTEHLEASWTFVNWMTSITPQTYLANTGLIPSNKNVDLSLFHEKYPYYEAYVAGMDEAMPRPPLAEWSQIQEIYINYLKQILTEKISVELGLSKAAKEMDEILQKEKGR